MAAAAPTVELQPLANSLTEVGRVVRLVDLSEARLRRQFLDLVGRTRGLRSLEEIAALLEAGQFNEALAIADDIAPAFSTAVENVYTAAGLNTAEFLRAQTNTLIEFNSLNSRAQGVLQAKRANLIAELTATQRQATLGTLNNGLARGLTPDRLARELRGSIGLTAHQQQQVDSFRGLLEDGNTRVLRRELRDRRFDGTVRRAAREGRQLTPAQIDRMTERYRENFVRFRANTIARTEALATVHEADTEMWEQAVEARAVERQSVENIWRRVPDEFVRDSHAVMEGQVQPLGVPFTSGNGALLMFPGDTSAPLDETINCRCVLERRIVRVRGRA